MKQPRVIALGFFDGVHLGHCALLRTARRTADALGCAAAALTFDRPPASVISGADVPLLTPAGPRADLMRRLCGIDEVLTVRFDRAMMEMPWDAFVREFLCARYGAIHLVCGHDHRFGWRGQGNPERLRQLCGELNIGCDVVEKVRLHGETVSSSLIRGLLREGRAEEAAEFLGHPHGIRGHVAHGVQLGRTLGVPTANLPLSEDTLAPAFGVYAARVVVDGQSLPAVTNIGVRPTVGGAVQPTVESWILDFDGDLYDKTILVELHKFLRPERKFDSLELLRQTILEDAAATRAYFTK